MGKRVDKASGISIPEAVALHLETKPTPCTARQCMKELLEEVKKLTQNRALTIQNIKSALREWLSEGWVVVNDLYLQVTRAGRAKIKQIAEEALKEKEPVQA